MPDPAQLAFTDALGGMNAADPPHRVATNQLARMVNCVIVDGLPTTRPGVRVVPLSGSAAELIPVSNCQGLEFFNPGRGQGGIPLADDSAMIAWAAGGRKFVVRIRGRRDNGIGDVEDITNGLLTNPQLHLVWWGAWEDLLIAQDGNANAFVWDSKNPAEFSVGYNSIQKTVSRIPNGATVLAYAHGRGVAIVNNRFVLVGDSLHRTDQSSSINLKSFEEQVYWATGQYFLPPSQMGEITAAKILPIQDTAHGHEDLIIHCIDGAFSLGLNVYPRAKWIETQMTRHVKLSGGATGPYAVGVYSGDQIFRTLNGIESLRSARAVSQAEGSPFLDLGAAVGVWLKADYKRWLRFCSVCSWYGNKRLYVTTHPIVRGRWRWHRGILVRSFDPLEQTTTDVPVWEGLHTFPPQIAGIVQMVTGRFMGEERMFAATFGNDHRTRLIEFSRTLVDDVLEDGTRRPIRCQAITRGIDIGRWWESREYIAATLFLRSVVGTVKWSVSFRTEENVAWKTLASGTVVNPDLNDELDSTAPRSLPIPLGHIPKKCDPVIGRNSNEGRSIQFLVRWEGSCQFQGVRVTHGDSDLSRTDVSCAGKEYTFVRSVECGYDDFEYAENDENPWFPNT